MDKTEKKAAPSVPQRLVRDAHAWLGIASISGTAALYYTPKSNFDKATREDLEAVIVGNGWGEWRHGHLWITARGRAEVSR